MHLRRGWLSLLLSVTLLGCSEEFDPDTVVLTGRWTAQPNALEVASMTVDIVETENGEFTGTGQFTGIISSDSGTLTLAGFHIASLIQINMFLQFSSRTRNYVLSGTVVGEDEFNLLFPNDESGVRVQFRR